MKAVGRLKQTDFKLVSFSPPFEPLCYVIRLYIFLSLNSLFSCLFCSVKDSHRATGENMPYKGYTNNTIWCIDIKNYLLYHFSEYPKIHAAKWGFLEVPGGALKAARGAELLLLSSCHQSRKEDVWVPKSFPWFLSSSSNSTMTGKGKGRNVVG